MHDPTNKFDGTLSPKAERIAKIISFLGQPPFLSIIPFLTICMVMSDDKVLGIKCSAAAVLAAVVVPVVIILYFSKRYGNSDRMDVENKDDRRIPMASSVLGYTIGAVLLYLLGAPWPATVMMICYAAVTAVMMIITRYWKISLHACGATGPSVVLSVVFWPYGLVYFLLFPPIAWSRYVLRKHTPLQLAMGAVVGFALTAALLWVLLRSAVGVGTRCTVLTSDRYFRYITVYIHVCRCDCMEQLTASLKHYPSQRKVARKLLEYGIRVQGGIAYCGDIAQTDTSIARACEVDRRVVRTTLEHISSTPQLDRIFSKLRPMLSLVDVAENIDCSAIVIIPTDARIPGIIADVTTVLYNSGITLRQAVIKDDGERESSTLQIVVDGKIQESTIMLLKSCRGVASVLIK